MCVCVYMYILKKILVAYSIKRFYCSFGDVAYSPFQESITNAYRGLKCKPFRVEKT